MVKARHFSGNLRRMDVLVQTGAAGVATVALQGLGMGRVLAELAAELLARLGHAGTALVGTFLALAHIFPYPLAAVWGEMQV